MDWIDLAIAFVLIGTYSVAIVWLAYKQGQQSRQFSYNPDAAVRKAQQYLTRPKPTDNAPGIMSAQVQCPECRVHGGSHHPQCPNAQPKERRPGQRRVAFSVAKRQLESREETAS